MPLAPTIPLAEKAYACISEASLALGRLDGAADRLLNPWLLVRPAIRREAVSTSALEGTYATLVDVLEADFIEESRRPAAAAEVLNYVAAAERGLELIKERPISWRLIAELQRILIHNTRGDGYDAGRLRAGVLRYPLLNISPWLERRRSAYQEHLLRISQVSIQTANTAVARLVKVGILREATGRSYGRTFVCVPVLRVIEDF